jgi:hypothetical protein
VSAPQLARSRPRRRRHTGLRTAAAALGAAVVFAVGIALGEALHDNPQPGGTQTLVRTLTPLQLPPAARTTVTVSQP